MHPFKEIKSKTGARFEFATHKLLITQIPDNIPVSNNVQMTISNERLFLLFIARGSTANNKGVPNHFNLC